MKFKDIISLLPRYWDDSGIEAGVTIVRKDEPVFRGRYYLVGQMPIMYLDAEVLQIDPHKALANGESTDCINVILDGESVDNN